MRFSCDTDQQIRWKELGEQILEILRKIGDVVLVVLAALFGAIFGFFGTLSKHYK